MLNKYFYYFVVQHLGELNWQWEVFLWLKSIPQGIVPAWNDLWIEVFPSLPSKAIIIPAFIFLSSSIPVSKPNELSLSRLF